MNKIKLKKYTNKYNSMRKRKLFLILLVMIIISIILGVLYLAIIDRSGKGLVKSTVFNYMTGLNVSFDIKNELILSLKNNVILTLVMWFLGVSLFGALFEIIFLVMKGFTLGFSISAMIYTFKFKGLYVGLIYLLPSIFNMIIYFILGFFAINYSIYLYKYLFKNLDINLKYLMNKYLRVLLISLVLLIISSLFEVFIVPNVLKLFTKTLF